MKPVEVYSTLEAMISKLNPDRGEAAVISDMLDTIKLWENTIHFYSKGHYDRGVLARQAQGYHPPEDARPLRHMAAQSTNMRRHPNDSEN